MTAAVIAAIGLDANRFNAVTISTIVVCCIVAVALPLVHWEQRSHNAFAWAYSGGVAIFGGAALYFDNAYILLGIYPNLVALADVYWYRRLLTVIHFTLIVVLFVVCSTVIDGPGRTNVLVAAPMMILTALFFGAVSDHLVRAHLTRKRFVSTVKSLLEALYMRDGYTGERSEATLAMVDAVADELKLSPSQRVDLSDIALLHDIGKIGIPNSILQKPGKLDPEEWKIMRSHPEIGEKIVGDVPGFEGLAKAIRHEHERWDGGGYPDGIAGDEIPLASRIVFACDAYHAMISDRPYRPRMTEREARAELLRNAGTQFDARVVDALVAAIDRGRVELGSVESLESDGSEDLRPIPAALDASAPALAVVPAIVTTESNSGTESKLIEPDAAGRHSDVIDDEYQLPGAHRIRTAMSMGAWALNSVVIALAMVVGGFSADGAAFLSLFIAIAATAFSLRATAPQWWMLGSGLAAYALVPLAAWRLEAPAVLVCLVVPSAMTMAMFWGIRPLRILQELLLLGAFVAVPLLTLNEQSLTFVAVCARAFPGVIFAAAVMFPQVSQTSFDRERFSATMYSLLRALQARDGYTGEHSEETLALAMRVADELGLDDAMRAELKDVALLHDIGKIGVPDEILHKPGKLTEDEWEIMRRHPEIGQRIVGEIPGFENIAKAIRHEHERWDGAGYPDRIAGEEIPLASRIVLVCDAFHAMTSDRPYREALGLEVALSELSKHAGTQFDPVVVDALLKAIDEGLVEEMLSDPSLTRVAIG